MMSSESISPASFYEKRGYGYKRYERVAPNRLSNIILLYEKYPIFKIENSEIENYPLVLEVEIPPFLDCNIHDGNGCYFSKKTIYLNPIYTKIIFRNQDEMTSTLSKTEPSIETKMVHLYEANMAILSNDIETYEWVDTNMKDSQEDISIYISEDKLINKLKGFMYAYLIASNQSIPDYIVKIKRDMKLLRNLLSAVIASPNGLATSAENKQLEDIYNEINDLFYQNSEYSYKIKELLKQKASEYDYPQFESILQKEHIFDDWIKKQSDLSILQPPFCIDEFHITNSEIDKTAKLENYLNGISTQIALLENKCGNNHIPSSQLPQLQNGRISQIKGQKDFVMKLFNEYLEEAYSKSDFLQSRYNFATSGGKLFKEELKERWDTDPSREYINSLRCNLNEFQCFDINSSDNQTLKSFAAFCQKGDADIDKLEDYLISNLIGDFRISFSLWGIIFGFAEMPKTFTNKFFASKNMEYITEIYKYIFEQIHGIHLEGSIKPYELRADIETPSKMNQVDNHSPEQTQTMFNLIPEELKWIFNSDEFKSLSESAQKYFKEGLLKHYFGSNKQIDDNFIKAIEKLTFPKSKTKWEKVVKYIKGGINPRKRDTTPQESSLFQFEVGKDFYCDSNTFYSLRSLLPEKKSIQKKFKEDIEWFQAEYIKGESSTYYAKASRENERVIESFERYIRKKKYNDKINIDRIISELKRLYNVR
jgi:hypothetical protein